MPWTKDRKLVAEVAPRSQAMSIVCPVLASWSWVLSGKRSPQPRKLEAMATLAPISLSNCESWVPAPVKPLAYAPSAIGARVVAAVAAPELSVAASSRARPAVSRTARREAADRRANEKRKRFAEVAGTRRENMAAALSDSAPATMGGRVERPVPPGTPIVAEVAPSRSAANITRILLRRQ